MFLSLALNYKIKLYLQTLKLLLNSKNILYANVAYFYKIKINKFIDKK